MKTKRFLALLTALVMVIAVMPGLAYAAEGGSLPVTESYVAATLTHGTYTQEGTTNRPYAVSWGANGTKDYRMGVVAFDAASLEDKGGVAELTMTVYLVQNVNESNTTSTVTVYAMDPAKIDPTNAEAPVLGDKLGVLSMPASVTSSGKNTNVNVKVTTSINLSDYFSTYPDAEKIALILTNRDDVPECNSRGMIGFYGKGDTGNEPQLVPIKTTEISVELKSKDVTLFKTSVADLIIGEKYTPTDDLAPAYLIANGKLYSRTNLSEIIVAANATAKVEYEEGATFKAEAFNNGMAPILPSDFTAVKDGKLTSVKAEWTTGDDGKYTAVVDGVTVNAEVKHWDSEYIPAIYYCSGTSNGANFGWKTDLKYNYSAGHAIFEAVISTEKGKAENAAEPKNRLLSYGNSSTSSFDGAGPIMRYLSSTNFEYHDGAWKDSSVPCEVGKTYIIHTEVNLDDKTYRMYAQEKGTDVVNEITNGPAKFRNQSLANIDRFFFHGDDLAQGVQGDTNGCPTEVILSHFEAWLDGFTEITITYKAGETEVAPKKTTKTATGAPYTDNDAQRVIYDEKAKKIYVLNDITKAPVFETVDETKKAFNVEYNEVTATAPGFAEVVTVQGQTPVLPATTTVTFSDGQTADYSIKWDDVDVTSAGEKTATGSIEELGLTVDCKVDVKELTVDNETLVNKNSVATNNGGWNWYVEPSGTHIQPGDDLAKLYEGEAKDAEGKTIKYTSNNDYKFQHDRTYMGWVEDSGDIVIAQYDHNTDTYDRVVIHEKLESDDHNNPAVVVLPDGRIMAVYTMHTNEPYMYFRVTKEPEDITQGWWPEQFYYCETNNDLEANNHGYNATYPTIFLVHDDPDTDGDVIYAGWRGVHWKPTLAKFPMPDEYGRFGSKTDGEVVPVMGQTQVANTSYSSFDDGGKNDGQRRPYTKYDYDSARNLIYITYTANHPDNDKRNHIYYMTLNVAEQKLYTASGKELQPLPKENKAEYKEQGALDANGNNTNGQWGVMTVPLRDVYPDLVVFDASEQTGASFTDFNGINNERRGWTWDISHNEKGEPCIVYADITATPPGENGALPDWYLGEVDGNTRSHHYYWYARWDSESGQWVKTFLTYAGKWFHQNATQERCYSGGLTFDHNAKDANVIFLSIPTEGKYGNVFEIYRWESDDHGATWTKRQALTKDSPVPNARPNAIYNYRMNEDGSNVGPRLLWISGEYRYWMNYEYQTGVMTDFQADGFITQDDPTMIADATLYVDNEAVDKLPTGNHTLKADFLVTNTSIGDGKAKFAIAHYSKDGKLIDFKTLDETIPARSVPQTSVSGADKDSNRGNGLSAMGEPQVEVSIDVTSANISDGDTVKLFAWNVGIEHPMSPIISIPVEVSTSGNRFLYSEDFTYEGDDKLLLDDSEETFNGWTGKAYDSNGTVAASDISNVGMKPNFYAAVTKTAFGNSGIHLYRVQDSANGQGIMASHSLPTTDGKDYTLEFDMRYINEWSWNNVQNVGFTLSHGVPTKIGDTDHPSAIQFRQTTDWGDENGRNNTLQNRNSVAFDSGSLSTIGKYTTLYRVDNEPDPNRYTDFPYHDKLGNNNGGGAGRYDTREEVTKNTLGEVYIHDYVDSLMVGALYHVKVDIHPAVQLADITVFDGYRAVESVVPFNTAEGVDWDTNPIDTISFSVCPEKSGELYVDNLKMYLTDEESPVKVAQFAADGTPFEIGTSGTTWNLYPKGDGRYVFFSAATGEVIDVNSGNIVNGGTCGMYGYKGSSSNADANQCFYIDDVEGGKVIWLNGNNADKDKPCYIVFSSTGVTLTTDKTKATVFTMTDPGDAPSATVLEIVGMIEDGTYEATMDALLDEE